MGVYEFREGWLHGADAGAAVNYVGERAGDSSDSGFELPAYTTVDLLARYPLASNATLGVNVNNLFDRRYYERSYNNVWSPRPAQPDHEPDPELLSPLPPPGSHAMQGRTPLLETLRELECEIRLLTVYARECCGCYEILRRKLDRLSGLIGRIAAGRSGRPIRTTLRCRRSACACATRRCRPSANWRSTFARACA